jgi:hypothetical protein
MGFYGRKRRNARMTRYYFDLRDHLGTTMDEEGMELNDLQRAQEEAARSLVDIARDAVAKHDGGATQGMAVECGTRTVPFCTSASGSKSIGCGSIEATALCGAEPMLPGVRRWAFLRSGFGFQCLNYAFTRARQRPRY